MGGWFEITQPQVEDAGLKWRGEHSWVSHANIAFSTGYTPEEREKLVDVYMAKFKEIFGEYPKSVGSWYIDAHTLNYMYEKYGIIASCNCKDQIRIYPLGRLLESGLLSQQAERIHAGPDPRGANPGPGFPDVGK